MPSHPEAEAAFRGALSGGTLPAGLTAVGDLDRRFAVYRNNVAHSLAEALAQRFPVVQRLVGAEFFAAMAAVFVRDHPPESPLMMEYGARLPAFLEGFGPARPLPYLPDVARLELLRGEAYHAADADPVPAEAFAAAAQEAPEALVLRLHPSVRLLRSDWPVQAIWQANQPGGDPRAVRPGAQAALVHRSGTQVATVLLPAADAAFLAALVRGETLGTASDAADEGFSPMALLGLLLREGLIVGIDRATARA